MMWDFGNMGWGGGFGFGLIFMLIFWGLVIWGIFSLVKAISGQSQSGMGKSNAEDILKERYAKGEISKEEFDRIKKDLR